MPAPKTLLIGKRMFVRGKTECFVCEHKFKYLLPVESMPWWNNLCSVCSDVVPAGASAGKIVVEPFSWDS